MPSSKFSKEVTVSFQLGVGVPLLIAALVLCGLFIWKPDWRYELQYIALVLGGTAAIYSAFYVGAGTRQNAEQRRMENTFKLIRGIDDPELLKLREVLHREIDHKTETPEEIVERISADQDLRTALRGLLNVLEDVAVAMRTGYIDEQLVAAAIRTMWCRTARDFRPYIETERDRLGGSDTLYQGVLKFGNEWDNGKYRTLNGRIPDDPCDI